MADSLPQTTDDHLKRKSEDIFLWNKYQKTVSYTCPVGFVVHWPNTSGAEVNKTDFELICHDDAKWHPLNDKITVDDLPSCIRKLQTIKFFTHIVFGN